MLGVLLMVMYGGVGIGVYLELEIVLDFLWNICVG